MTSAGEVIETQATVIETDITSPLDGAELWLEQKRSEVAEEAVKYADFEVVDTSSYKQAKRDRGALNKKVKAINAERIDKVKALTAAVERIKAEVDGITDPLTDVAGKLDEQCKRWESDVVSRRRDTLRQAYEDAAPDIALPSDGNSEPLVSFDVLVRRYGDGQLGKKWFLYGTGEKVAESQLMQAIEKIADAERTIDAMVAEEDRETVKALYFSELDMDSAMAKARELAEQRRRILALEEERRARDEAERKAREEQQALMEAELARREAEREAALRAARDEQQAAQESNSRVSEVREARRQAEEAYAAGYRTGVLDMPGNNGTGAVSRAEMNAIDMVKNGSAIPQPSHPSVGQGRMPQVAHEILSGMAGKQHLTLVFEQPVSELVLDVSVEELEMLRRILRFNHVKGVIRGLRRR